MSKPFRILSIDGGGIRGIFPACFLADLEAELSVRGYDKTKICDHFDLICGTSTGGIIAIALTLGISARTIYDLYFTNAKKIFHKKAHFFRSLIRARYQRDVLEELIRKTFQLPDGSDARLEDCRTRVCIPVYDLVQGKPAVLKSRHHQVFVHDYHIPAYQAAMATAAAPTYFDPYCGVYPGPGGRRQKLTNKVDGGVFANNPTLIGMVEAMKASGAALKDIKVLSIGTGHQKFADSGTRKHWGLGYWLSGKRLIELFMQGQSQQVQNLVALLHKGISGLEGENFTYERIDTELDRTCRIALDTTDPDKLLLLSEKAHLAFQHSSARILASFFCNNETPLPYGDNNRRACPDY